MQTALIGCFVIGAFVSSNTRRTKFEAYRSGNVQFIGPISSDLRYVKSGSTIENKILSGAVGVR